MTFELSSRVWLRTFLVLWLVGLAAWAQALWRYSATPGTASVAPKQWPAAAPMPHPPGRATLVMLAHPHCPCTRASLAELGKLLEREDVEAWVLFLRPAGAQPGWEKTDLWKTAAAMKNVHVLADADGAAARAFGAETSGHVLFYDAEGSLRFSGGITQARGHEGPSAGGEAIHSMLHGTAPRQEQAMIFGCPLESQESPP